jgi:AraC family transcriptional regulator
MAKEVSDEYLSGALYAESLSLALASRLDAVAAELRGARSYVTTPRRLTLPRAQRIQEHINSELDTRLSVAGLAALVGMSPSHFAACFKGTFGMPVHRYVMSERIVRAKHLLVLGQEAGKVALACGFSSQSHFTEVFRRAVGSPPTLYKRARMKSQ